MSKSSKVKKVGFALATLRERFLAFLADFLLWFVIEISCLLVWLLFYLPGILGPRPGLLVFSYVILSILSLFSFLAGFFIFIWMPYKNSGQSFGKKRREIMIMVIESKETMALRNVAKGDFLRMFYRAVLTFFEGQVLYGVIPWYLILNEPNRQIIADQVTQTIVVQFDKELQLPLKKPRE